MTDTPALVTRLQAYANKPWIEDDIADTFREAAYALAAAIRARTALEQERVIRWNDLKRVEAENDELRLRSEAAEQALAQLRQYVQHPLCCHSHAFCGQMQVCTCGLDQVLAGLPPEAETR